MNFLQNLLIAVIALCISWIICPHSAWVLIQYKYYQFKRMAFLAVGVCPKCKTRVNYTPSGRAICPNCSGRN